MAINVISNKKNTSAVLHINAGGTITVAGTAGSSTIATDDEVITGASIVQAFAGCDGNSYISVSRGGNVVAIYDSTGYYDYAGSGMSLTLNKADDIVIAFEGSGNCYLMLELQKEGTFNRTPYMVG